MSAVILTEGLTKRYGKVRALEDLDLEVRAGEVFGFLGPNGAGKTTTIRLLLDVIRPTAGRARIFGQDVRGAAELRRRLGYLPGELTLDPRLTAGELLAWYGNLQGGVDEAWRGELVERLGLDPSRPCRSLSTGNKKKVGLVQAFQHRPELAVLDEPTGGLDPIVQRAFRDLVRELVAGGVTVFLSSHVLQEVEDLADRLAIIRRGRLVTVDTVAGLTRAAVRHLVLRFADPVPAGAFQGLAGVDEVRVDGRTVEATVSGSPDALIKAAARFEVVDLSPRQSELEEIFLAYYREDQ
jgi:ABC-2 type transport system ATP-binding protein